MLMKKRGSVWQEFPIVTILLLIAALIILWGVIRMITLARERGLPGIFGG